MVAERSLQNLEPHKYKKGHRPPRSPGRPRKLDWVHELNELAMSPKERIPFLRRLLHKKTDVAMNYLAGKPREMITIDANIKAEITQQEVVKKAAAIRAELEKSSKTMQDTKDKTL